MRGMVTSSLLISWKQEHQAKCARHIIKSCNIWKTGIRVKYLSTTKHQTSSTKQFNKMKPKKHSACSKIISQQFFQEWTIFPNKLVGPSVTTSREYIKHHVANKYCAHNISICIHVGATWLQQNAISTNGLCSTAAQQTSYLKTWDDHVMEGYYIKTWRKNTTYAIRFRYKAQEASESPPWYFSNPNISQCQTLVRPM